MALVVDSHSVLRLLDFASFCAALLFRNVLSGSGSYFNFRVSCYQAQQMNTFSSTGKVNHETIFVLSHVSLLL